MVGVPYELFWHLNPRKLKSFYKADEIAMKRRDAEMWHMGQYILSAVSVSIDHCLNGKKAKSEYVKEPIMRNASNSPELTEEEIKKQRELFVTMLLAKKANFELNKKSEGQ